MHSKEANINSILLLKGKHGSGSIWEIILHLSSVNISRNNDLFNWEAIKKVWEISTSGFPPPDIKQD